MHGVVCLQVTRILFRMLEVLGWQTISLSKYMTTDDFIAATFDPSRHTKVYISDAPHDSDEVSSKRHSSSQSVHSRVSDMTSDQCWNTDIADTHKNHT